MHNCITPPNGNRLFARVLCQLFLNIQFFYINVYFVQNCYENLVTSSYYVLQFGVAQAL